MIRVLHVIHGLGSGGGPRALISLAKYSARQGDFHHRVVSLTSTSDDMRALIKEADMDLIEPSDSKRLYTEIEAADIVQLSWWNTPEIDDFLRSELPEMRLITWFHTSGDIAPQIITPGLIEFSDFALACSPYTYQCSAITNLPPETRLKKTGMVYGAADFSRLHGYTPLAHSTFNIGYLGIATLYKMYPNFIKMSAEIAIPDAKFIICGHTEDIFQKQVLELQASDRFEFRGFVDDIRNVIGLFDVCGYPLGIRVAAELAVQEVLYAGVPIVAFPAGGIKKLVINDYTGFIVHSEAEYRQAIEYLYHNPEERKRLGQNAHEYARQIFGAENAAAKMNPIYKKIMRLPKRKREWNSCRTSAIVKDAAPDTNEIPLDAYRIKRPTGAQRYIESLGNTEEAVLLIASMTSQNITELFTADEKIASFPRIMFSNDTGGILQYEAHYPEDPYFRLWAGLIWEYLGRDEVALSDYSSAIVVRFPHWRIYWYLARVAERVGDIACAKESLTKVMDAEPQFYPAVEMAERLKNVEAIKPGNPFSVRCPHCGETVYVDRTGNWQCPCCTGEFIC